MRVAIISDVHSNLEALSAVFDDIRMMGAERVYCLGDVVGYGAHPDVCLDFLLGESLMSGFVQGNHDYYAVNFHEKADEAFGSFNPAAWSGLKHSRRRLMADHLRAMSSWPEVSVIEDLDLSLAHGSFSGDHISRYVMRGLFRDSEAQLSSSKTRICAIGHTHDPYVYGNGLWEYGETPVLVNGSRVLFNVGSVGQPRDGDPRACYGLLTFEDKMVSFRFRRVEYDIASSARDIQMVGLPSNLADRLFKGE